MTSRHSTLDSTGRAAYFPSMQPITRREMLRQFGIGLGVAALPALPVEVRSRVQAAAAQSYVTLSATEAETLRAIVARLIPADENGPGALEARADRFIDRGLAGALKNQRDAYSTGLAGINAYAKASKGAAFAKLSAADQDAVLTDMQANRATGFADATQFFTLVRTHTLQGTF